MIRIVLSALLTVAVLGEGRTGRGAPPPRPAPITYELMIDGESFLVEANRVVKLQSKQKPGVTYQVAIRVAPLQRLKLSTLQIEYDLRSKVESTGQPPRRGVKLQHELGFTMLLTEVGPALAEANRDKALDILAQSVLKTLRDRNAEGPEPTAARLDNHQFEGVEGRGVRIRRRDAEGIEHSTLVYILVGKTFTGSCIVEFLDVDSEDVLPLVKKTIDSIRGVEAGEKK